MKYLPLSCLAAAIAVSANAQTVYLMDFNTRDTSGYPGASSEWNIYAAPSNIDGSAIADKSGSSAAGITLGVSGTITDSTRSGVLVFNNATGGPSWVTTDGSLGNTSAAGDYFFTDINSNTSFTLTFGNLTEGSVLNLDVWSSREDVSSGIGWYEYSLDGGSTWAGFTVLEKDGSLATADGWDTNDTQSQLYLSQRDGNNNARYMNVAGITVGSAQNLMIRADDNTTGNWASIGAIQLTVIPEPTTYALLFGLAVVGITYYRRKQS